MVSTRQEILTRAIEIVKSHPQGIRYSVLKNALIEVFPLASPYSIEGYIWNLDAQFPEQIYKAARGLFRHTSFIESSEVSAEVVTGPQEPTQLKEEHFYPSFAEWLKNELEEVTKAIPLGGSSFGSKWGTPDVIGVYKTLPSHIIKAEPVIVSAEIKLDDSSIGLITAFGQACAYKRFSHKVYLVIPKTASESDRSRIETLCLTLGIGLILFDNTNKENPKYEIVCRAIRQEPDIWYVNETMKNVEHELFV